MYYGCFERSRQLIGLSHILARQNEVVVSSFDLYTVVNLVFLNYEALILKRRTMFYSLSFKKYLPKYWESVLS